MVCGPSGPGNCGPEPASQELVDRLHHAVRCRRHAVTIRQSVAKSYCLTKPECFAESDRFTQSDCITVTKSDVVTIAVANRVTKSKPQHHTSRRLSCQRLQRARRT